MSAVSPAVAAASQHAAVEVALVLLERMGLSPADLVAAPRDRAVMPTFAEYVPVVSAAVSARTRRAYGSYWNRIVEHWGARRLDEPTPSEIRQLMTWVKTHVVARRNARGGRSAQEHLVAALRCLYRRAVEDGLISEADDPARKVAKPRRLPSTRRAVPEARLAEINEIAASTGDDPELDTLLLRLHTETACRRGGALALRPADLDPDQCLVLLREKGETVRWQPVSPTLMARLVRHGQERHAPEGGRLLRYADGRPVTSRRYDHLWTRIGRQLAWVRTQQVSTHRIRHTTLTWVEGRGVALDATFRAGREHVCAGAAALPGACRGRGPGDGHAVDLGFLVPGCAGWQDVASELVALADRLMRLAHGGGGGVGARRGTLALVAADGAVPVSPGAALLEEMLAGWRRQQRARRLTARLIGERERVVRQFTAFTGCWPWQWTAAQAEAWLASGGWAHSTVRSYQGALAMFLEYVCDPRYGWVSECEQRAGAVPVQVFWERNTAAHVCEHEGRAERRPLTRGELQAFFDAADDHVEKAAGSGRKGWLAGFRDATLFKVIYGWGLRRREAAMLDVADFAPNPAAPELGSFGVCHVRYGKAMRGSPPRRRAVATVMPWVAEALAQYLQDVRPRCGVASHPALWLTERGERISPRSIDERFAAWRAAAGLPRELSVHCLRHSYISHLIEDGADPLFVQLQAGHSWASTTATYTTVGQDARNRMLRSALARAFEGEDGR